MIGAFLFSFLTLGWIDVASDVETFDVARVEPIGAVPLEQLRALLHVSTENKLAPDERAFRTARVTEEHIRGSIV
jgi:hypothetical protein